MRNQIKYSELTQIEQQPVNDIISDAIRYDFKELDSEGVMSDPDATFNFFETEEGIEIEKI